ncbi:MAG: hypothetical protein HY791_05685 [Deltaproteobacteria bacterium]|nr:hypothetical protein [Deltaproteobacteria bacterium]
MAIYQPPERVILSIGAAFRVASLTACARRLTPLARRDEAELLALGFSDDPVPAEALRIEVKDVEGLFGDKTLKKHDTPLPMSQVSDLMSKARKWLVELREIASLNLAHDQPSLVRVWSPMPEIRDGYPRDLLEDLELRLTAASDLKPRLDDGGLKEKFLSEGHKLAIQLRTAIGEKDFTLDDLQFKKRKFYLKKGGLFILCKRIARGGRIIWRADTRRADEYHTREIDEPQPAKDIGMALPPRRF